MNWETLLSSGMEGRLGPECGKLEMYLREGKATEGLAFLFSLQARLFYQVGESEWEWNMAAMEELNLSYGSLKSISFGLCNKSGHEWGVLTCARQRSNPKWYQWGSQGNSFPPWAVTVHLGSLQTVLPKLGIPSPRALLLCSLIFWQVGEQGALSSGAGRRIPAEATTSKHEVSRSHHVGVKQIETEGNFFF